MSNEKAVPTEAELKAFNLDDPSVIELINRAQSSNEADSTLEFWDAVKKYKVAVFWAMFLSTSLIMEGFDLSIVRFCLSYWLLVRFIN
jgi:SP family general alpha glucoside:H+ symporter-like MFS transporter